ncbi:biofilm-associated protein [Nitrosopumilus sp. Nsub]|uniref:biofilm-associated protein n=1 Tax=Nitrosopumilus sp. Nsub TaxID=1776294 RepID=UPI000AA5F234|nr:biofilm-associated protein [Nitrosopumilus sp. Nsub]
MKKMINVKKSSNKGILLSVILLFSVSLILVPSNGYAEEINVKSMGVEKTSIITFTNDGTKEIKTFRIWLSQDAKFESFKTEKGWVGEKNSQGVIVFSSSESIKENQSVKFGIKTDKPNPVINWKGLDKTNSVVGTGVISTTKIQKVDQNPNIEPSKNVIDNDGEIFSKSEFRIIPDKPNAGSTIRVVGENFGASQLFEFYIDSNKIGNFETDNNGKFITTMKIPNNISEDRIEFKVKNNQGEEKIVSLRLGDSQNRIEKIDDVKITINGIGKVVHRGDNLELFGTASPGSAVIIEIKDPQQNIINSRTEKVDGTGNWKLDKTINIPFDAPFGKYTIITSDGKNQNLKYWTIETDKTILLTPAEIMFDPGSIIKFNGTATPNQLIELVLENNLGKEITSDIISVGESGFVEFEYQTTENDDLEGTWTLIATQNKVKEFIYVGYGEMPSIPVNIEFDKTNYKSSENAIISLLGKPSEVLKIMIINPSGAIIGEDIEIKLQEDGRATYTLELGGYGSGIYTAVAQKGNAQSSEKFSVGLQLGSGPIEAQTTQLEYEQGERILLIGSTNPNVLLNAALVDPNGVEIKKIEIPSNSDGTFKVEEFKIPNNAISGTWKINVNSGSNLDKSEFEVILTQEEGIIIDVGDTIEIPGFGESIKFGITTSQKTSVTIQILDKNDSQVGESLSCTPTTDFKCEILWTFPKDIVPGTYVISVNDSKITVEKTFEIE